MNDDKPKSIWKKSWKGPRLVLVWLALVLATLIIFSIGILISGKPFTESSDFGVVLIVGAGVASLLFGLWLFIRWLCCWRNFKRFLFGLACFITLIALFYAEEDWRGKHGWEKFKRQWEAKGEKFDYASVIPAPVLNDQNFAFSPVWIAEIKYFFRSEPKRAEAWYGGRIYSKEVSKLLPLMPVSISGLVGTNWADRMPQTPEVSGSWAMARMTALEPWQSYYRGLEITNPEAGIPITQQPQLPAQDVLLALSKFDPAVDKLRQASQLPYSRFPIGYDADRPFDVLLPHLSVLKQLAQVLQLRAIAELQNGQSELALSDVKLMLCLANSVRTEPFLISHLVRIAILQVTLQPIYEGLAENKWSDAQLAELNSQLAKLDFLADYERSIRGERASAISYIDYLRRIRNFRTWADDVGGRYNSNSHNLVARIVFHSIPAAFFYQNELTIARMYQLWVLPTVDLKDQVVSPARVRQDQTSGEKELRHHTWPYKILARMLFPAVARAVEKFAYAQESVDLARVAVALERYRLVHGDYPESLGALVPQLLKAIPHDIINGQPLHYRRTSDGQFVLYSVGWNETDDGGVVGLTKGGSVDINKGDWVWRYPQK